MGLGFKLVLGPLLMALIYFGLLARTGETTQVTISKQPWARRSAARSWRSSTG